VLRANAAVHLRHDRFVLRSADACVVSSDHQVAELVELYRVDRRRVRTIRNGFDPDFLRVPAEAGARPRGPHLVFVGRLVPKKGLDHLLDVQALLRERFPEARLTLVLGHRAAVEHRPTLRMVEERTRALPGCELRFDLREDELFDVLADADVGVVPSRGYESIPTVVLEMLGSGLPVFATHRWGVPEVLAERFALSGDAVADARTLGDFVVGELPTWDRAAWAARHRCHGYDRLVGEYLSLYDELLDATGSAS
jgi:glycosyltransferase involved in cell wall biosynthesis